MSYYHTPCFQKVQKWGIGVKKVKERIKSLRDQM